MAEETKTVPTMQLLVANRLSLMGMELMKMASEIAINTSNPDDIIRMLILKETDLDMLKQEASPEWDEKIKEAIQKGIANVFDRTKSSEEQLDELKETNAKLIQTGVIGVGIGD